MKDAKQGALGEPHTNGTNVMIYTVRFNQISNLTSGLHFFDMVMLIEHERAMREARREERATLLSDLTACRGALKELLDSELSQMPPAEAGVAAQNAWADRRAAARNNAAALSRGAP